MSAEGPPSRAGRARAWALALVALFCAAAFAPARGQDSAQSNASFWLQERARGHSGGIQLFSRQAPRVRRLVPNKKLARPTLWRRPARRHLAPPAAPVEAARGPAPALGAPSGALPAPPAAEATPTPAAGASPAPTTTSMTPPAAGPDQTTPNRAAPATPANAPAPAAPSPPRTAEQAPPPVAPPEQAAAQPAETAARPTVLVIGDNVGSMLVRGLAATEAGGSETGGLGLTIVGKTHDSSGLVRDDFYDWQKALREILAGPEKYDAVAIMIGSNDRQDLRDATGRLDPLSDPWKQAYRARVDALLAQIKEKKIPIFWVGLPVMRGERYSSDLAQLNDIYRTQTEAAGGRFVDLWDAFADEKGRFSVFGPDVSGQIVKLRTSDGVHFTKAGQRKLAWFAEQAMRALIDRAKPPNPAIAALPQPAAPAPATIVPGATTPGPGAPQATPRNVPTPAPPPKPEFGPILPLTGAPLAPNAELVGATGATGRSEEARATIPPELATGAASPAPKGRADDFAWPRR